MINRGTETDPIWVNIAEVGGRFHIYTRSTDEATLDANLLYAGITYTEIVTLTPAVIDAETGQETTPAVTETVVKRANGAEVLPIGSVTLMPAVLDADGNVTTAAVVDNRFHAQIILSEPASTNTDEHGVNLIDLVGMAWTLGGVDDTNQNASETGKLLYGTTALDPDTITSPSLRLA
jgi:hypothetical protein